MSIVRKFGSAIDALVLTSAIMRNTGRIPSRHRGMVLVEPTSVCNLKCSLCPTGTDTLKRDNKYMPLDVFNKILKITKPYALGYVLNLFGEPMFHPQIGSILEKTTHLPVWLSSNLNYGEGLAKELARWDHVHVICSLDTVNPEEYCEYRVGGDWDVVMRNLDILVQGKCKVHPQFLVSRGELGAQVYLDFAQTRGIASSDVIIKRKMENFRLDVVQRARSGRCHSAYCDLYFNCDGYLLPCCNNVREDVYMQHIDDIRSIEDIFRGPEGRRIRQTLARDKNAYPSCTDCNGLDFWKVQFPQYLKALNGVFGGGRRKENQPTRAGF